MLAFTARARCSFVVNSLSTSTSRLFSAKLFSRWLTATCMSAWGYSIVFHEVPVGLLIQPVQDAENGSTTHQWCISHFCQFCLICLICYILGVINEDAIEYWSRYWSLVSLISIYLPTGLHVADHKPLSPEVRPALISPYCSFFLSISHH